MRNPCRRCSLPLLVVALASGCHAPNTAVPITSPTRSLAAPVERAHGAAAWRSRPAVQTGITVRFGGNEVLAGTMLYDHHRGRVRIDVADGSVLLFDGRRAWVSPAAAEAPRARFHLLTWPYFLAAPFKLRDPGSHLSPDRTQRVGDRLGGGLVLTARLTFEPGVGDTPDDWYELYVDPVTDRLRAMAYIVTYGTPAATAEQAPHAIVYEDFRTRAGVTLAHRWIFHDWNAVDGVHGDPLGTAELHDLRFVTPPAGSFEPGDDAREDTLPP